MSTHTSARPAAPRRRGLQTGLQWPLVVVGMLATNVTIVSLTAMMAVRDPSHRVEPEYDVKGLAWDQHKAERARQESLGWKLELDTRSQSAGKARMIATAYDRQQRPLAGARVEATAFHAARPNDIRVLRFTDLGQGEYEALLDLSREGDWVVELRVTRVEEGNEQVVQRTFERRIWTSVASRTGH